MRVKYKKPVSSFFNFFMHLKPKKIVSIMLKITKYYSVKSKNEDK